MPTSCVSRTFHTGNPRLFQCDKMQQAKSWITGMLVQKSQVQENHRYVAQARWWKSFFFYSDTKRIVSIPPPSGFCHPPHIKNQHLELWELVVLRTRCQQLIWPENPQSSSSLWLLVALSPPQVTNQPSLFCTMIPTQILAAVSAFKTLDMVCFILKTCCSPEHTTSKKKIPNTNLGRSVFETMDKVYFIMLETCCSTVHTTSKMKTKSRRVWSQHFDPSFYSVIPRKKSSQRKINEGWIKVFDKREMPVEFYFYQLAKS